MPWHISEQDGKFCVVKDDTNETVTCHDTEPEAKAHIAALYANEPTAAKAGARHSARDTELVNRARKLARELASLMDDLGATPEEIAAATKAGEAIPIEEVPTVYASVKALGDRTLELRVAWGYDNHKEQFHPERTDFDLENYGTPPVAYHHGYTQAGKPAPKPIYIGKTVKRENRTDGHYFIAKLNNKPEADRVWAAALKGEAYVSPATAGHLRRKDPDGTLTYWPIVEVSAWDGAPDRRQAHPQSLAFPVLKALYDEAGIPFPTPLDPSPPQTPGEGVSAGADTSPDVTPEEAARYIVTQVASAVLARSTRNT